MRRKLIFPGLLSPFAVLDVYSLCEVCVGSMLGTTLCRRDTHKPAGRTVVRWASVFFFISDADEAVCGAVMADVVSAVFHLTHLVQWNKWPGSKCCFTVAESASPNISTDSVVLDTVFIYRQRLPLPLEDKCKKKRVGKAEEARRGWTVWQLHAGHRSSNRIFDAYQKDCLSSC